MLLISGQLMLAVDRRRTLTKSYNDAPRGESAPKRGWGTDEFTAGGTIMRGN
jgi:hypothetical protein